MSTIKNGGCPLTLNGKEYSLLFSLNALDAIQDKFGGYDKLDEVFNAKNKQWIKDTRWLLTLLLNEGRLATNENLAPMTEQEVGRLVHAGNLREIQNAIFRAFAVGTTGGKEGEEELEEEPEKETEQGNGAAAQEK